MKQKLISNLNKIKDDLIALSKYIYNNPEESFKEYKSCNYIISILEKYNFNIQKNYLGTPTAFFASKGTGHPKICFICEYDADPIYGHITGNNIVSSEAIGASIALSQILDNNYATIIVLGCPGQYMNGSKCTMVKQGTFNDIDVVLTAHPYISTNSSANSKAVIPINLKLSIPNDTNFYLNPSLTTHCGILTHIFTSILNDNLPNDCSIQTINLKGKCNPYFLNCEYNINYLISCNNIKSCNKVVDFIKSFLLCIKNIFNINADISISSLPYEEMLTNKTLCRIFSHNLKEAGIIHITKQEAIFPALSLGTISHTVPCINPLINIINNPSIKYPSKAFAKETISEFANEQMFKSTIALALTGLDLIENKNLLFEIKNEFFNSK